jgi:hypothetical protein
MQAAEQARRDMTIAAAARIMCQAYISYGEYGQAVELSRAASTLVAPSPNSSPLSVSLYGALQLRGLLASARAADMTSFREFEHHANRAGAILGTDLNHWGTAFGPTNILLHELTAAIERDDIAYAANLADRIETTHLPLERRIQGQIDSARAYFLWKRGDDAVAALLSAEARAPEQVRPNPMARELTRELLKRSPLTAGRRFREMAVRLRAI